MRLPQPITPFRDPSQTVQVIHYGRGGEIDVPYIRCLDGRVLEAFELWALEEDGVREVHPYARVKLLSKFREDNFHTHFFNSQQLQIPFLGRRALNKSVEFLDIVCTTQHFRSRVDYTPNLFVHSWGVNPTDMIPLNVSPITRLTYV